MNITLATERSPLIQPQNYRTEKETEKQFQIRLSTNYEYAPKFYTAIIGTALSAGGAVLALKASAIAMPTLLAGSITTATFTSILATGGLILVGVGAIILLYALVKIAKKYYKENNTEKFTFQVPLKQVALRSYERAFESNDKRTTLEQIQQARPPLLSNTNTSIPKERFKDYILVK